MKLKLVGFAVTVAMAVAMLAYAQPPGRGARGAAATDAIPPVDAVKTYLGLTDSQVTGFQAIRQTARTASEPILEQLRTKTQALRTAMNTTPVNATTLNTLQAEIAVLQTQLEKFQSAARAQMTATLSVDQKAKLATLTAAVALREEIQGAAGLGLLEGAGPGGPGGRGKGGPGFAKGKGGGKGF